jgi:peptidoglycan/xylan/chitin deacetylase (PgdA/CDA1 family)
MSLRRDPLRRPVAALVLATGLALALPPGPAPAAAPATPPAGSPPATPPAGSPPPKPPRRAAPLPVRMRPVGCRAGGPRIARAEGTPRAVRRREVALSFDDGPAAITRSFVRMLRAERVPATFFVIGEQVSPAYRAVMREELRDGDAIGDHTWSHPDLVYSGEVASQIRGTREVIRRETGYQPCLFRPPYGAYDAAVVDAARTLGLATVTWDVDPQDWALPGTAAIEQRVLAQVRPGSIILSHDGGGPRGETLAAYPDIIASLRRRGYRFVTVPQLLGFRTVYRRCYAGRPRARHAPLPACNGA